MYMCFTCARCFHGSCMRSSDIPAVHLPPPGDDDDSYDCPVCRAGTPTVFRDAGVDHVCETWEAMHKMVYAVPHDVYMTVSDMHGHMHAWPHGYGASVHKCQHTSTHPTVLSCTAGAQHWCLCALQPCGLTRTPSPPPGSAACCSQWCLLGAHGIPAWRGPPLYPALLHARGCVSTLGAVCRHPLLGAVGRSAPPVLPHAGR